jgi:hypothetical protein
MASEQQPKSSKAHVDADTVFSNYQVRAVPAIGGYQQCPCTCCCSASWQCFPAETDGHQRLARCRSAIICHLQSLQHNALRALQAWHCCHTTQLLMCHLLPAGLLHASCISPPASPPLQAVTSKTFLVSLMVEFIGTMMFTFLGSTVTDKVSCCKRPRMLRSAARSQAYCDTLNDNSALCTAFSQGRLASSASQALELRHLLAP